MEIKFVFRERCYSISIGHETPWFSQLPFILISEEFYDNPEKPREVSYARVIWMTKYA